MDVFDRLSKNNFISNNVGTWEECRLSIDDDLCISLDNNKEKSFVKYLKFSAAFSIQNLRQIS